MTAAGTQVTYQLMPDYLLEEFAEQQRVQQNQLAPNTFTSP